MRSTNVARYGLNLEMPLNFSPTFVKVPSDNKRLLYGRTCSVPSISPTVYHYDSSNRAITRINCICYRGAI